MRDGANGDLVFAVALAVWWGDQLTWNDAEAERMLPAEIDGAWEYGRDEVSGY